MRLIDADKIVYSWQIDADGNEHDGVTLQSIIRKMPTIIPEQKTGHWKPYLKEGLRYQCSVCDSRFTTPWEHCPHCGAKMEESEDK